MSRQGVCELCGAAFVDRSSAQSRRYCSDDCRRAAWDRVHYRGVCELCGAATSRRGIVRCAKHVPQSVRAGERREFIARRWSEGALTREIAVELGSTKAAVGVQIARMRADGWDLPHRYRRRADAA